MRFYLRAIALVTRAMAADSQGVALGYPLSGFQPLESVRICVKQRFRFFAAFAFLCG